MFGSTACLSTNRYFGVCNVSRFVILLLQVISSGKGLILNAASASMFLLLFLFLLGQVAGLSDMIDFNCAQRYETCKDEFQLCSDDHHSSMKCITDVTRVCYPSFVDIPKGYEDFLKDECERNFTVTKDWGEMFNCQVTNLDYFRECELVGEFRNAAEVCTSTKTLFDCFSLKTKDTCGKEKGDVFDKGFKPINDFLATCKKSREMRDYVIPICTREIMKCDRNFFHQGGYSCSALQMNFRCYSEVFKRYCIGSTSPLAPYLQVFDSYVDQIPDYCNPDSDFRQNLEKSFSCMVTKTDVFTSCYEAFQHDVQRTVSEGSDDPVERTVAIMRSSVQMCHCIAKGFGSVCGKEAAFVARYLLNPVEEFLDNQCIQLTEEKCNGSSALESTLILILSLAFILIKRDE